MGVNVGDLQEFAAGTEVNEVALREARLVQGRRVQIKVLGDGEFTKKLTVHAHSFSKSALEKIEAAGGSVTIVIHPQKPVADAKSKAEG